MNIVFEESEITAVLNRLSAMPYNQVADIIAFIGEKLKTAKAAEPKTDEQEAPVEA